MKNIQFSDMKLLFFDMVKLNNYIIMEDMI